MPTNAFITNAPSRTLKKRLVEYRATTSVAPTKFAAVALLLPQLDRAFQGRLLARKEKHNG